jgi:hypothetical protein
MAQTDFAKMCATIHSFTLKSEAAAIGHYKSRQGGPSFHYSNTMNLLGSPLPMYC